MNFKVLFVILNLLFIILLYPPENFAQTDLKAKVSSEQIDSVFAKWNDRSKPGIVLGVLSNGKIEHLKAFGAANLENKTPIDKNTKFLFDGLSDQMLAYCTLKLEEKGKVKLNDYISQYIETPNALKNKVKIKHLLEHNSSMYDLNTIKAMAGWHAEQSFGKQQAAALFANQTLGQAAPGEEYNNNRFGLKLIQDIIEKVSGQSIATHIEETIFKPFDMNNSVVAETAAQIVPGRAASYYPSGDTYVHAKVNENQALPFLLYTTAEDACKWSKVFFSKQHSAKNINQKMETFATRDGAVPTLENRNLYLGQHAYWDFKGVPKLYIIGTRDGYNAKLIRFPAQDLAVVVLGNAGAYNGHYTSMVADLYLQKYYKANDGNKAIEKTPINLSKAAQEKYCGSFWHAEYFVSSTIEMRDDTLRYFEAENNWGGNILPYKEGSFYMDGRPAFTMEFKEGSHTEYDLLVPNGTAYAFEQYDEKSAWRNDLAAFEGRYCMEDLGIDLQIKKVGEDLFLCQDKKPDLLLTALHKDSFKGGDRNFAELNFVRDAKGKITTLNVRNRKMKAFPLMKKSAMTQGKEM